MRQRALPNRHCQSRLCRAFLCRENPIGQHVVGGGTTYEIIGVVQNMKSRTLGEDSRSFSSAHCTKHGKRPFLSGLSTGCPHGGQFRSHRQPVHRQIHALDSAMAVYNTETMEEHLRQALFLPRLAGTLVRNIWIHWAGAGCHWALRGHELFRQPPYA